MTERNQRQWILKYTNTSSKVLIMQLLPYKGFTLQLNFSETKGVRSRWFHQDLTIMQLLPVTLGQLIVGGPSLHIFENFTTHFAFINTPCLSFVWKILTPLFINIPPLYRHSLSPLRRLLKMNFFHFAQQNLFTKIRYDKI